MSMTFMPMLLPNISMRYYFQIDSGDWIINKTGKSLKLIFRRLDNSLNYTF